MASSSRGYQPQEAISAWFSTEGEHSDFQACAWFQDAVAALKKIGQQCTGVDPTPIGEQQTHASFGELDFTDPAHVTGTGDPSGGKNAARGFELWAPAFSDRIKADVAATATCELPASQRAFCSGGLAYIRALFRSEAKPEPPY